MFCSWGRSHRTSISLFSIESNSNSIYRKGTPLIVRCLLIRSHKNVFVQLREHLLVSRFHSAHLQGARVRKSLLCGREVTAERKFGKANWTEPWMVVRNDDLAFVKCICFIRLPSNFVIHLNCNCFISNFDFSGSVFLPLVLKSSTSRISLMRCGGERLRTLWTDLRRVDHTSSTKHMMTLVVGRLLWTSCFAHLGQNTSWA